jgi:hypothetical protein
MYRVGFVGGFAIIMLAIFIVFLYRGYKAFYINPPKPMQMVASYFQCWAEKSFFFF